MAIRKPCFADALRMPFLLSGRRGNQVISGEDTELCVRAARTGWPVWYVATLVFTHHLEKRRLTVEYLEKLNQGFGRARPYIELYSAPMLANRRIFSLRRAAYHWRKAARAWCGLIRTARHQLAISN